MKNHCFLSLAVIAALSVGCKNDSPEDPNEWYSSKNENLVIVNAGGYGYSTSSITLWNEESGASQDVFARANDFSLGDVAQSATVQDSLLWIVVNNSNVIFAVDTATFVEKGRIDKDLISPRYIHFISEEKAYVTQMYTNKIAIVNPKTYSISGYIDLPVKNWCSSSQGASEEMVQIGDYVYVNQWSYGKEILKIDTKTDEVVKSTEIGIQPYSIVKDWDDTLWAICDGGGWSGSPMGYEAPTLVNMKLNQYNDTKSYSLPMGASVSKLCTNGIGTRIYFTVNEYDENGVNVGGVYMLDVTEEYPQFRIVVPADGRYLYSMTVSPNNEEIFVADALDFSQNGVIYRYSKDGELLGKFNAGIIPTSYAWILK